MPISPQGESGHCGQVQEIGVSHELAERSDILTQPNLTITSATRKVKPELMEFIRGLKPGERIRLTQRVRVGRRQWQVVAEGAFRDQNFLATGIATDRIPEDDIVVPTVHFAKDNGELSSVALDEHSRVERI